MQSLAVSSPSHHADDQPIPIDALIVGAGPVGLFAAFQFGLLGMRCAIVDALPFAGGQTVQLYADKPIYDIPGIPVCTGRELTEQLLTQIKPFGHALHLGLQVSALQALSQDESQTVSDATAQKTGGGPRYCLSTTRGHAPSQAGPSFSARFVCITAGVGAFVPRPLPGMAAEALAPFDGHSLHWHLATQTPDLPTGPHLIAGGGPEAVQAALHLAQAQALVLMPVPGRGRRSGGDPDRNGFTCGASGQLRAWH